MTLIAKAPETPGAEPPARLVRARRRGSAPPERRVTYRGRDHLFRMTPRGPYCEDLWHALRATIGADQRDRAWRDAT